MNMNTEIEKLLESGRIGDVLDYCIKNKLYNVGLTIAEYFKIKSIQYLELLKHNQKYSECFNLCEKYGIWELRKICIPFIKNEYIHYPSSLPIKKDENFPRVTFSITTCKRYELFEKTMNSFLNCCLDLDLIDEWICVDDNSSQEDRNKMQEKYPFFKFIMKTPKEKGHPESMNIILENVKSPFLFHMEDDWQFFCKRNYITDCIQVLESDKNYGQCLINRNYMETENETIVGGIEKRTFSGFNYYVHEYCSTQEEQEEFNKKYNFRTNCAYWPHFSLRPSLIRTEIFKSIGKFNCSAPHFEMEFSYRYKDKYVSTFLESINALHIGRLTSERGDKTKLNAYDLNSETQFVDRNLFGKKYNMKTVVINLDRRPDRWNKFVAKKEPRFLKYTRFSAIDGSKLVPTEQLQRIFEGNDYNMREGMVGCALSHIKLMIELVKSSYDIYCIFEDDIDFVPNFQTKLEKVLNELKDFDLCYLGHHLWKDYRTPDMYDKEAMPIVEKWDTNTSFKYSMGGTGGYLISKKGALSFLNFIEKQGMKNGIDTMQQRSADIMNVYYVKPHLIYSDCWNVVPNTDTDIQQNFRSLSIPEEIRIQNELKLYDNITEIKEDELDVEDKDYYCVTKKNVSGRPSYRIGNTLFILSSNSPNLIRVSKLRNLNLDEIEYENASGPRSSEGPQNEEEIKNLSFKFSKMISLGDNKHVYDAIQAIFNNREEYPFDLVDNMSFEIMYEWIEKIFEKDFNYIEDVTDSSLHDTELIPFNGVNCLTNRELGIKFPHEDASTLQDTYIEKFENLHNILVSQEPVIFFYCTRYNSKPYKYLEKLYTLLSKINKNVKLISINGAVIDSNIKRNENIVLANVEFPEKFRSEWNNESIEFDQKIFRNNIHDFLKKFVKPV